MKKDEVWKPKVVEYGGEIFEVGEKIGDTVFTKKDDWLSYHEFQGGIIAGFQKQHYGFRGAGSIMGEGCHCQCHSQDSNAEEPCENCKHNDKGFVVEVLVTQRIHIGCLTKDKSSAK